MILVKNSYGISAAMEASRERAKLLGTFGGSSLNRKAKEKKEKLGKKTPKKNTEALVQAVISGDISQIEEAQKKTIKPRTMSQRTRSKIRQKVFALARVHAKLTFVTLTFVNKVADELAVKVLRTFLDNAKKRFKDFEYLWIAEKQSENRVFENNIHFHLVTNKYWPLEKWWNYWLDVQKKYDIVPRNVNFKPTSAFNVRAINSNNVKGVANYLTKYLTKSDTPLYCQVWNCSKKISRLYTCGYTGINFIRNIERLAEADQLGGEHKMIPLEHCNLHLIPLNKLTMQFYKGIEEINKENWKKENE
ncbi:MAG: hypothetical protein J0I09_07495 [Sphingobacteriia bacterium]|nr:hypothetical protein [Sphingobacteriia bacterium]